ncbi:MAG: helix-turn-helix domain-containing protein [Oscillospiraceae bacterium]|nr:helix-turn-helix domain-containing protein [Oscillospiraceae bacterium]
MKKLRISEGTYREALCEIAKQNAVSELNQYFEKENEEMPKGKQTDAETVERVRKMKAEGKSSRAIAEETGCGKSTVDRICKADEPAEKPAELPDKPHTDEIPDHVLTAVRDTIDYEEETVEDHLRTIRELQHEVEQRRTKAAVMRKWLEGCGYESTAD